MAIVTLPQLPFGPECGMGQRLFDMASMSETTGTEQVRLLAPPRWTLKLVQPARLTLAEAGLWTVMLTRLRGRANVLAAWDPIRPAPQGTLRGTLALASALAAGATALQLDCGAGQAGRTLLPGDWLQLGTGLGTSQLVMVAEPTAAVGSVVDVQFLPPLRQALSSAAPVQWQQALAYFRMQSSAVAWTYANRGMHVTGLAGDFMETWS